MGGCTRPPAPGGAVKVVLARWEVPLNQPCAAVINHKGKRQVPAIRRRDHTRNPTRGLIHDLGFARQGHAQDRAAAWRPARQVKAFAIRSPRQSIEIIPASEDDLRPVSATERNHRNTVAVLPPGRVVLYATVTPARKGATQPMSCRNEPIS